MRKAPEVPGHKSPGSAGAQKLRGIHKLDMRKSLRRNEVKIEN